MVCESRAALGGRWGYARAARFVGSACGLREIIRQKERAPKWPRGTEGESGTGQAMGGNNKASSELFKLKASRHAPLQRI